MAREQRADARILFERRPVDFGRRKKRFYRCPRRLAEQRSASDAVRDGEIRAERPGETVYHAESGVGQRDARQKDLCQSFERSKSNQIVELSFILNFTQSFNEIEAIGQGTAKSLGESFRHLFKDAFRGELDSAIRAGAAEIVFIHGAGTGRLKEEIWRIVAGEYPSCSCKDAPFRQFGVGGATLIVISRR